MPHTLATVTRQALPQPRSTEQLIHIDLELCCSSLEAVSFTIHLFVCSSFSLLSLSGQQKSQYEAAGSDGQQPSRRLAPSHLHVLSLRFPQTQGVLLDHSFSHKALFMGIMVFYRFRVGKFGFMCGSFLTVLDNFTLIFRQFHSMKSIRILSVS